jgi:hypothetical protein
MNTLDTLLKSKMTRKEYLVRLAAIIFIISGISTTLEKVKQIQQPQRQKKRSFGSGGYGL